MESGVTGAQFNSFTLPVKWLWKWKGVKKLCDTNQIGVNTAVLEIAELNSEILQRDLVKIISERGPWLGRQGVVL